MDKFSSLANHFPYIGLFSLLILGGFGLPFPEDATLMLCGVLISHRLVEPVPAIITVYAGLLPADFFLYSVGKKYGRKVVAHEKFKEVLSPERLLRLEEQFKRRGGPVILLGRHIIGLRAQLFLAAGVLRMSPITFLVYDALSATVTMALFIGIGYAGGSSFQIIRRDITRVEHVAVFLIAVLAGAYMLIRYIRERKRNVM